MAAKASEVVEQQLELLAIQSSKGTLTWEEVQSMERLVKMQILLRMKTGQKELNEQYDDISVDELKQLRELLK